MENILKLLVRRDYTTLENYFSGDNLEKGDILKLYYVLINIFAQGVISDELMFVYIYLSLRFKIDYSNIKCPLEIFKDLDGQGSSLTQSLLEDYESLVSNRRYIESIISTIRDSDCKIKILLSSEIGVENFSDIIVQSVRPVLASFLDTKFRDAINLPNSEGSSPKYRDINKEHWKFVHGHEISKRLGQIVTFFGIDLLLLMGVKLITLDHFYKMNYDEKVNYYIDTIKSIDSSLDFFLRKIRILSEVDNKVKSYHYRYKAIVENKERKDFILLDEIDLYERNGDFSSDLDNAINSFIKN